MNLTELLNERGIRTALIVDDVYDAVPTAADIDPGNDAWSNFNDDLTPEQHERIIEVYPAAEGLRFDERISDDDYVAAVWQLREELGSVAAPVFEIYLADQAADTRYVQFVKERLEALNLTVKTSGRNFAEVACDVELVVIDLFLGQAQDPDSLDESKHRLREVLQQRPTNPPLVILMSRSPRLVSKRDEFRDEVGLLDSGFRILKKEDIEGTKRLELHLERLAENRTDSLVLARLFFELEVGVRQAAERTVGLLRKLRLSDIGQIQQLLLNAEGQPAGSYLVDIFDRVLLHEIEREIGIIDAAVALNGFSVAKHPPPYVAGSADLQELVQRLLTQNENRLRLPGSVGARVAFGDLLRMSPAADAEQVQHEILVDLTLENVVLVLTPACDLQRGAAPRILLIVGTVKPLAVRDWSYNDDARTTAIRIDGELCWVKWNLKHIDTVSRNQINLALDAGCIRIVGRLREGHALELQQRVLAGLGRVGQIAALPGTFPVELDAFYPDLDGRLKRLEIEAFSEGAVCFVGRDSGGPQALRLVITETSCDDLLAALDELEENKVAQRALPAIRRIKSSTDLLRLMTVGLDLKKVTDKEWKTFSSDNGGPPLGLLAWNYIAPEGPLSNSHLSNAGVVLLIRDMNRPDVPGLDDAIRSGLIEPSAAPNPGIQLEEPPSEEKLA